MMSDIAPPLSSEDHEQVPKKTPPRHRWFPYITKVNETFYLHLGYKSSRGEMSELKSSKRNSAVKIPFGSPVRCDFYLVQEKSLQQGEFLFANSSNSTTKLRLNNLDSFLIEKYFPDVPNSFAKKVSSLIVEKKETQLARFFSLLSHSVRFDKHRDDLHNNEGEDLEDTIDQSFLSNKSVLKDFQEFYDSAIDSAKVLTRSTDDIRTFFDSKRKNVTDSNVRRKRFNKEIIDEREKKELMDNNGLEKQYYESLFGLANVPLANLKIHPGLLKQLSQARVESIISSMEKRFDPSLNVPVICPDKGQVVTDLNEVGELEFLVITKIHTVKALMDLDSKGQFMTLASHESGTIPCFVANLQSEELVHYGNFRNNDVNYEFSKHSAPQDLLRSYISLYHKSGAASALSYIERMSYLARFTPDVTSALRKLCSWSILGINALVETFVKYEKYETTDKKTYGYKTNLSRQERMVMPDMMFKKLGKLSESYFMTVYQKVIAGTLSLQCCIDEHERMVKMEKVCSILSSLAEFRTYENIKIDHPGAFEYDQLKHFFGAEIRKNGVKNEEALRLEVYYNSVISDSSVCDNLEFESVSDIEIALRDSRFDTFQMVIAKFESVVECAEISKMLLSRQSSSQLIMIMCPSWKCQIELLNWIDSNIQSERSVQPIFFRSETTNPGKVGAFMNNLTYSVLVGNVKPNKCLKVFNESLDELPLLVSQLGSLGFSVGVVVGKKDPLFKVHLESREMKVTYFGSQKAIDDFRILSCAPTNSSKDKSVNASESETAMNSDSSVVSDSNSSKKASFDCDDSGVYEFDVSSTSPFKCSITGSFPSVNGKTCAKVL